VSAKVGMVSEVSAKVRGRVSGELGAVFTCLLVPRSARNDEMESKRRQSISRVLPFNAASRIGRKWSSAHQS